MGWTGHWKSRRAALDAAMLELQGQKDLLVVDRGTQIWIASVGRDGLMEAAVILAMFMSGDSPGWYFSEPYSTEEVGWKGCCPKLKAKVKAYNEAQEQRT